MTVAMQGAVLDKPFIVDQIFSGPRRIQATAVALSASEIELRGPLADSSDATRFVWLEFGLGPEARRIRALGEIVDMGPETRRIRFKHIFPDHRQLLMDYLESSRHN
ncbi:MAG: hypothetical protein FJ098_13685 [Deltaproteobacteria bacterium]|nr:hypothetical protein [Deltaproteobacteria bacterium]